VISVRKFLTCILILALFFTLTACRSNQTAEERILEIRELFQTSTQNFSAELTANYGDRVHTFTLRFSSEANTLEVLAPEIIAGIVIAVSESGTVLHFDGAELDTGPLTEDGLSPLAALPTIVYEWKEGHITGSHFETFHGIETVVMTTAISDRVQHMTWFNRETGLPIKAELFQNGTLVLGIIFEGSPLFGTQ